MSLPSWTHLGIGIGVTALLITAAVKASGSSNVRFVNFNTQKGTSTIRIKKMENGLFEAASWGEGVAFSDVPTQEPLATYTFARGVSLNASGNADVIAFLHSALPDIPVNNLFVQEGNERCARPGCEARQ